jgi:glutamine cyclotransferase
MIASRQMSRCTLFILVALLTAIFVGACSVTPLVSPLRPAPTRPLPAPTSTIAPLKLPTARNLTYRVVATYPHDRNAFTQGLVIDNGVLYEGTGLNGRSSLRRVDLASGAVLQSVALDQQYFGEGITTWGDQIIQLTWQSQQGFVYDKDTFELLKTFAYPGEGWGLTHDDRSLIMSDGTPAIRFLDPVTLHETRRITVTDQGQPVVKLNELEYVHGEILAHVWQTDRVVRISPDDGRVIGWIDLSGLLSAEDRQQPVDVLNGIAYDAAHDRLFVTGKLWPRLFEIELAPQP